jgi:hypothetical protein
MPSMLLLSMQDRIKEIDRAVASSRFSQYVDWIALCIK